MRTIGTPRAHECPALAQATDPDTGFIISQIRILFNISKLTYRCTIGIFKNLMSEFSQQKSATITFNRNQDLWTLGLHNNQQLYSALPELRLIMRSEN